MNLTDTFKPGRIVKVRIISENQESRHIIASIRQATVNFSADILDMSVGDTTEGVVAELQKTNVVLTLKPSGVRSLISFITLANHRGTTVSELKTSLKPGALVDSLVVVSPQSGSGFRSCQRKTEVNNQIKETLYRWTP